MSMANIVAQWLGASPEVHLAGTLAGTLSEEIVEISRLRNFLISHAKDYPGINPSILEWAASFFDYTAKTPPYPENISEKELAVITNIESTFLTTDDLSGLPALVTRVAHFGNYFSNHVSLEARFFPQLYKRPTPNAYLYIKKNQPTFFHSFQVFLPFYEWMTVRTCSFYEVLATLDSGLRTQALIESAILGPYFLEVFFNQYFDKNELGSILDTISEERKQRLVQALHRQLKYAPEHLTMSAKVILTVLHKHENKEIFENAFPELLVSNHFDFRRFIYQQCPIAYTRSLLKILMSSLFALPACSTVALAHYIFAIHAYGKIALESHKPGLPVSPFAIVFPLAEFHELSLIHKKEFLQLLFEHPLAIVYLDACDPATFQDLKDSCALQDLDSMQLEKLSVFNTEVLDAIRLFFSTDRVRFSHYHILEHLIRKFSLKPFIPMQVAQLAPLLNSVFITSAIDLLLIQDLNGEFLFTAMAQNPQCKNQLARDLFALLQIRAENAQATLDHFATSWKGFTLEKVCEVKIFRDNIILFGLEHCLKMVEQKKIPESILYFFITGLTGDQFLSFVDRQVDDSFQTALPDIRFRLMNSMGSLNDFLPQISPNSPWGYEILMNAYIDFFVDLDVILLFSTKQSRIQEHLCLLPYVPKNLISYIAHILPEEHKPLLLNPDFKNELLRSLKKMTPHAQEFFFNHLIQWLVPTPPGIRKLLEQSSKKSSLDLRDALSSSLDSYLIQLKNVLIKTIPLLQEMVLAFPFERKLRNHIEENMPIYERMQTSLNEYLPPIPDELTCLLSGRLLDNPAKLSTYPKLFFDRDFLEQMVLQNLTCPYTRAPLTAESILLSDNEETVEKARNLKKQCRNYEEKLEIGLKQFTDSYSSLF